jgi:hypothetical protein
MDQNDLQSMLEKATTLKQAITSIYDQAKPFETELEIIQQELLAFMAHENLKHLDTQAGHKIDLVTRTQNVLDKERLAEVLGGEQELEGYYSTKQNSFIKITLKN